MIRPDQTKTIARFAPYRGLKSSCLPIPRSDTVGCPSHSKCAGLVHVAVRDGQACRDREGALRGEGGGARRVQRLRGEQQEKKRN